MWKCMRMTFVMLGVATQMVILAGCSKNTARTAAKPEAEKEEAGGAQALTVEEVLKARCSHGLTIECAETSYVYLKRKNESFHQLAFRSSGAQ